MGDGIIPDAIARNLASWIEHSNSVGAVHVAVPINVAEKIHAILVGVASREANPILERSGTSDPQLNNAAVAEVARLTALINTPEIIDFVKAVQIEAVHQRERWGSEHDEGKTAADWFWLLGYLAGKALHSDKAGDQEKLLHHIITTAAACANWHAQVLGKCDMRPGIATTKW